MSAAAATRAAPVEYAVAVDRYLAAAELGDASRRVYRISLTSWAWPLVGRLPPRGTGRRLARPPVVPLAVLDRADAAPKLAVAVAHRSRTARARTVNRELSALRSAVGWWLQHRWIDSDPTAGLRQLGRQPAALLPLTGAQRAALFQAPAGLREHALWHLLQDTGAAADLLLGLDASDIDLHGRLVRPRAGEPLRLEAATSDLLAWLLAGRRAGPLFLTSRRAPAGTRPADVCPLTGRARMSYRRAAEIFTGWTAPLDPAGQGWTLHQLRPPSLMLPSGESATGRTVLPARTL